MNPNTSLQNLAVVVDDRNGQTPGLLPAVVQGPPTSTWDVEPEEQAVPLSHYLWVLRRHRWKILSFVAISVVSTLIVSKRLTPIYESTATVDVDRRVPTGVMGQESMQSNVNDSDQFLATQ